MQTNPSDTSSKTESANPQNPPAATAEPLRPRDQQDREIASGISNASLILKALEEDEDLQEPLSERGYDEEEVSKGQVLQVAAHATFVERQRALGDQEATADKLNGLIVVARRDYADFRRVARTKFKSSADLTKLALVGTVPTELQRFIITATTSYTEAGQEPYLPVFTKKGYKAQTLTKLRNNLAAIEAAANLHKKATADAQKATRMRDTAFGLLKGWLRELRETGKVAFRDAPEQAQKLDF